MEREIDVDELIDALIEREGGYVNHAADWLRPRFDQVARRAARLAAELLDTGVNDVLPSRRRAGANRIGYHSRYGRSGCSGVA